MLVHTMYMCVICNIYLAKDIRRLPLGGPSGTRALEFHVPPVQVLLVGVSPARDKRATSSKADNTCVTSLLLLALSIITTDH